MASPTSSIFAALRQGPLKVTVIGGGNWGTAAGKVAAENCKEAYIFDSQVRMWIYDEEVDGKSLVDVINTEHVNTKYLPGIKLPENLVACRDLVECCKDANLLVFVSPHQFLVNLLYKLVGHVAKETKAISLIKGCLIEKSKPLLCTDLINKILGIDCSVLSGANVAKDIAAMEFSETTIGYNDRMSAAIWQQLFDRPLYFRVNCVPDVHGVEICGAMKNVVALSAGFCDGLGYGTNTKASVIRLGVEELRLFACAFFKGILEETFFDSAGYADVITTCWGGRNVRCAKEFVLRGKDAKWEQIEKDLLNGQKLQGHLSCKEVYGVIAAKGMEAKFPLFVATYRIAFEGVDPAHLLDPFTTLTPPAIKLTSECNACILPQALDDNLRQTARLSM